MDASEIALRRAAARRVPAVEADVRTVVAVGVRHRRAALADGESKRRAARRGAGVDAGALARHHAFAGHYRQRDAACAKRIHHVIRDLGSHSRPVQDQGGRLAATALDQGGKLTKRPAG